MKDICGESKWSLWWMRNETFEISNTLDIFTKLEKGSSYAPFTLRAPLRHLRSSNIRRKKNFIFYHPFGAEYRISIEAHFC